MRRFVLALALTVLPVTALSAQAVEEGYPRGTLAVAAIERGDWTRAEALLNDDREISRSDPARLLNLGHVYMQTGRTSEALTAWRAALASDRHTMVATLGDRYVSTRDLAREALSRFETVTASR